MYIFWATAGIIFLALDLFKPNEYKLCFASSFLFCSIVAFRFDANIQLQLVSLCVFGFVFSFLIKTIFKKEQRENLKEKNLDDFTNKKALVIKDIAKTLSIDGLGVIEYNGEKWSAKSIDDKEIKAGTSVLIVSKENRIMNVKVLENADK